MCFILIRWNDNKFCPLYRIWIISNKYIVFRYCFISTSLFWRFEFSVFQVSPWIPHSKFQINVLYTKFVTMNTDEHIFVFYVLNLILCSWYHWQQNVHYKLYIFFKDLHFRKYIFNNNCIRTRLRKILFL